MQLAIKVPEGENGTEEWAIIEMQVRYRFRTIGVFLFLLTVTR